MSDSIQYALKEWPVICRFLIASRQHIILRKGGIAEGGVFKPIPDRFLLMPSYFHQPEDLSQSGLKMTWLDGENLEAVDKDMSHVSVTHWAQIEKQEQMDSVEMLFEDYQAHAYGGDLLLKRWFYKKQHPLWRLTLKVTPLKETCQMVNRPLYQKCRSWFELDERDQIEI